MTRLRLAVAVWLSLLLGFALPARALSPVTVETGWNEKTVAFSTFGVTSAEFDVAGFGAAGGAILGNTQVLNGVDGTTLGATVTVSTNSVNVVGFDYVAYSTDSFTLQVAQTVVMPAPLGLGVHGNGNTTITSTSAYTSAYPESYLFTTPVISTSSLLNWPGSVALQESFRAKVTNPVFYLSNLNKGATYYLTVDYGVPLAQGLGR